MLIREDESANLSSMRRDGLTFRDRKRIYRQEDTIYTESSELEFRILESGLDSTRGKRASDVI
jgi:hypothetical protein